MAELKTIHTKIKQPKAKKLLKLLYEQVLRRDGEFHFFYEPELIIRTSLYKEIIQILETKKIKYEVYKYPVDLGKKGNYCFECDKFKLKNIEIFKKIYHQSAVLALIWKKGDYREYIATVEHTACNMGGLSYLDEARRHLEGGLFRYQLSYSKYIDSINYKKREI